MNKSMKQLTQFAACAIAALSVVACSSEDSAQQDNAKQNTAKGVATFDGSQPGNDTRALTRTTATYTLGGDAKVFWRSADKIFVQDDANTFHQSNAANLYNPSNKAKAIFSLASGSFTLNNREVRYTGENGTDANTVTIATTQTQTTANDFSHLGTSGDCGTATATGSNGNYTFTLNHKASYLCFVPRCMNTDLGPNIKLTKIKVTADQPIAGKYDFSTGSLTQKAGETYSNTVTLNTSDFSLNTTVSSLSTNGAYMVVAPGTYNFTITYTIKDPATNVECDIVKTVSSYNCQEGKLNDITAWIDKDLDDYSSNQYYMWDAKKSYWYQYEWNSANKFQPVLDLTSDSHYPQNNLDERWYRENSAVPFTRADFSAKDCPNINEMLWYCMNGNPHWDESQAWISMGHLFKTGMWFKKSNYISGFSDSNYGSEDYRTSTIPWNRFENTAINIGTPTNKNEYFFLPSLGACGGGVSSGAAFNLGVFYAIGVSGHYWSSTPSQFRPTYSYFMMFTNAGIWVDNTPRSNGFTLWTKE